MRTRADPRRALTAAAAALTLAAAACGAATGASPPGSPRPGPTVVYRPSPEPPPPASSAPERHSAPRPRRPASSHGPALPLHISVRDAVRRRTVVSAPVDPIDAAVGTGIFPPVWGRAVYWTGSHRPASPSRGTTIVYAHACTHHICPFTNLHAARTGDSIRVATSRGSFEYRITRILSLPKINLAAFSFSGYDIALVTCELPGEGSELDNRLVLGTLVRFVPARG